MALQEKWSKERGLGYSGGFQSSDTNRKQGAERAAHSGEIKLTRSQVPAPREFLQDCEKPEHPVNKVFFTTLDPNNPLWDRIGYDQAGLGQLLSASRMPAGITYADLCAEIEKMATVDLDLD